MGILHGLGYTAALEGDRPRAKEPLEQSLERFLELGQHAPAGGRLSYLGELAYEDGDLDATRRYYERSVEELRKRETRAACSGRRKGSHSSPSSRATSAAPRSCSSGDWPRPTPLSLSTSSRAPPRSRRVEATVPARRDFGGALEALESDLYSTPVRTMRPRYDEAVGGSDPAGRSLTPGDAVALAAS